MSTLQEYKTVTQGYKFLAMAFFSSESILPLPWDVGKQIINNREMHMVVKLWGVFVEYTLSPDFNVLEPLYCTVICV